jgi:hypothetical protein
MGDFFQVIVDRDAGESEAASLAEAVLDWLTSEEIVEADATPCLNGLDDLGYAPGPKMESWVPDADQARQTRSLRTNGLELVTDKTVFWSVSTEYEAVCPNGHAHVPPEDWLDLAGEWQADGGPALMECPTCHGSFSVTEWDFGHGFAFGYLGFRFWNWPFPLAGELIQGVAKLVAPHRVALVYSKL